LGRLRAGIHLWQQWTQERAPRHQQGGLLSFRAAQALRAWRGAVLGSQQRQAASDELREAHRTRQLRGAWGGWVGAAVDARHLLASTQRSIEHWADHHVQTAFLAWRGHVWARATVRLRGEEVQASQRKYSLGSALRLWRATLAGCKLQRSMSAPARRHAFVSRLKRAFVAWQGEVQASFQRSKLASSMRDTRQHLDARAVFVSWQRHAR
jgi:hypothetical protein